MNIGGWQKVSLIDYPGYICAILFTQGCNFRCPYCHNPELVKPDLFQECITEAEIFAFLERRTGKLDAVSITGGEPTIQPDLIEFIKRIKEMGYLIKIDTNGSHPEVLENLIGRKLLDYIAMDIKAPLEKYGEVTRSKINPDKIRQSIETIRNSEIKYEFRTTVAKSLLKKADMEKIAALIKGARLYIFQKFVPSKHVDTKFLSESSYPDKDLEEIKEKIERYIQRVVVR